MMRIITGSAKGMKLETLEGNSTRPTSERIKGAMFSSIQFDVEGRKVLDLFAGSGQLGLEALSRGAVSATFVDGNRDAMEVVKKNAKHTNLFDKCRFTVSDCKNFIRKQQGNYKFDLVFVDPPYEMQCTVDIADRLARGDLLNRGAILVLESGDEVFDTNDGKLAPFEVIKSTNYGKKTAVHILLYRGEAE